MQALAQQRLSNIKQQAEIKTIQPKPEREQDERKTKIKSLAWGRLYILYPDLWQGAQAGELPSPLYNKHRKTDRWTDRQKVRDQGGKQSGREEVCRQQHSKSSTTHEKPLHSRLTSSNIRPFVRRAERWWRRWRRSVRVVGGGGAQVEGFGTRWSVIVTKKQYKKKNTLRCQTKKSLERQTVQAEEENRNIKVHQKKTTHNKNYQSCFCLRAVSSLTVACLDRSARLN